MRLVSFALPGPLGPVVRLGALVGESVVDLNLARRLQLAGEGVSRAEALADALLPPEMTTFLQNGPRGMAEARAVLASWRANPAPGTAHALADVRLLSPVPNPASLRDFYAFEEHVATGFAKRGEPIPPPWYELPVYYKGNARTIIGPDDVLPWPRYSKQLDFELELACVIGREGRNISVADAGDYIAGYTIMNDVSARDIQRKEMAVRLGPAKGKDFATVLGPWLVTTDEIGALPDLAMHVRVNGEAWSSGQSGAAYWNFAQIIAHVSMDETLYPGDVLGSGTVGRGCGLELDRWIQPGDLIELEIVGLGVLANRVGEPCDAPMPVLR